MSRTGSQSPGRDASGPTERLGTAGSAGSPEGTRRVFGVLTTYRRPHDLDRTLEVLAQQQLAVELLVVVDNDPSPLSQSAVGRYAAHRRVSYVPCARNLGPAGGIALGMRLVLPLARSRDWIVVLEDDDPPPWRSLLADLARFGEEMTERDPATAAVGLVGARFDWRRGRLIRIPNRELTGPVPVDYLGGNHFPFYSVEAIQAVGPPHAALFFGFEDLEHGLRLRRAGYRLYALGPEWLRSRIRARRIDVDDHPAWRLDALGWRRYYSLRSAIWILRTYRHPGAALRVTVVRGLAKPLANLALSPRLAAQHLRLQLKACVDGWRGRLGRTVEPDLVGTTVGRPHDPASSGDRTERDT